MIKVSIIVPIYNVSKYLHHCIDSLISQTHDNLEIILIDDGSTDGSGEICDDYAKRDSRITVIHQDNAGSANAKNAGLDAATGHFIAFVDSDDWVESNWIEKMLAVSIENDADVVECSFLKEFVSHSENGNDSNFTSTVFKTEDYLFNYRGNWTCALFWNKLYRSNILKNIRFHKERRCIDDEFFTYKAVTGAKKIVRIEDKLYHYRQRRSSVTQAPSTLYQRTTDDIDILAERHRWMKKYYPNIAMDYLKHDVDNLLYFARSYCFDSKAIASFRKAAKYYFAECLKHYPGKLTLYYAFRIRFYNIKNFHTTLSEFPITSQHPIDINDLYT